MAAVPYVANVLAGSIEKSQVELVIWDTSSLDTDQCFEEIKTIQSIQCVVLCFSVGDPDLIANIDHLVSSATRNFDRPGSRTIDCSIVAPENTQRHPQGTHCTSGASKRLARRCKISSATQNEER